MRTLLVGLNDDATRTVAAQLPGPQSIGSAPSASRALASAAVDPPDLVVVADPLPDQDAASLCRALRGAGARAVVLVLVEGWDRAAEILAAGADDVCTRAMAGALPARLLVAQRLVMERTNQLSSEARLRGALDRVADGFSLHDAQGRAVYMSPSVTRMLGYSPAELLERPLFTAVHPDDLQLVIEMEQYIRAHPGASLRREFRVHGANGELHWLEATGTNLLEDPTVSAIVGNFRDITEQKRLSEALRESEVRYRSIVEAAAEGVWLVDPRLDTTFVNGRMAQMLGLSAEEMRGRPILGFAEPAQRAELEAIVRLDAADGRGRRQDIQLRRQDGSLLWASVQTSRMVDEDGRYQGALAMVTDLSERRQQDELKARLAAIVESSDDAFIGTDVSSATIISWNPGAERLFGWSIEEALGQPISMLAPPERREGELQALLGRLRRGENVQNIETVRQRKDGTRVDVSLSLTVIKDRTGRITGAAATARDLTERKRAEARLRRREEQLRQLSKLDAIGSMAGGLAHDFNNLLSVILTCAHSGLEAAGPAAPDRQDLEEIRRAAKRGSELTQQLLAFSRGVALEARVLDLNDVVTSASRMLERILGSGRRLAVRCCTGPALVYADRGQLEELLVNLVVNARDAMENGGEIRVLTLPVELDEPSAARLEVKAGPYIVLSVSDNGAGMTADTAAHLFEPFFTTKGGQGTGLGLFTVSGIVQRCGGHIVVDSAPGAGTTFRVHLPRTEIVLDGTSRHAGRALGGGAETVLLVAPDPQALASTSAILAREGYQVLEAADADRAFAIVEQFGGPIHLLVADAMMPRMGGGVLATRLALIRPEMKILYLSKYSEPRVVSQQGRCMGFLAKPVVPAILLAKARELLDLDQASAAPGGHSATP